MQVYKNVAVTMHAHICMVYSLANHYFIIFFSSARMLSFHLHSWATHHHHFTTHKNPITNSIENQSQNQRKIQTHPTVKPKSTKINGNQTWNQPQHIKRKTQTHPKPSLISPSLKPSLISPLPKPSSNPSHLSLATATSTVVSLLLFFLCLINGFWDFELACLLRSNVSCICLGFFFWC